MITLGVAAVVLIAAVMLSLAAVVVLSGSTSDEVLEAAQPPTLDSTPTVAAPAFGLVVPQDAGSITLGDADFYGWSVLDRATGRTAGSENAETERNTTESMIKPWIVADYLRELSDDKQEPSPEALDELTLVIVDSNDPLAEKYYQLGGADEVVERMIRICDLADVIIEPTLWGNTLMTPMDAVRYGACLADGRAAGPQWTNWVLAAMRDVRGSVDDQDSGEVEGGRWGIIDGLPDEVARNTSIKNGWTVYEDGWHVNCLAIHPAWVISVMLRTFGDLADAAADCASVAQALIVERRP